MGGNVFRNSKSIKREYIDNTLKNYIIELKRIFPKTNDIFDNFITVGSCGKVPISGDIDLILDINYLFPIEDKLNLFDIDINDFIEQLSKYLNRARTSTKEQLKLKTLLYFIGDKINSKSNSIFIMVDKVGIGSMFTSFYQYNSKNKKTNKRVQIDIMVGNEEWLKFSYHSKSYKGNVKGLHRTQLILSLFSNIEYTFSHLYGVKNKISQKIEVTTVNEAINLLSKEYNIKFSKEILEDYFLLHNFIKSNLKEKDYNDVIDIYLSILDKTRADIPLDLQEYWIKNQERLDLTGKFLPYTSEILL